MTSFIQPPHCFWCKHFHKMSAPWTCAAFPKGMPNDIQGGGSGHWEPREGDNGIVFAAGPEGDEWIDNTG